MYSEGVCVSMAFTTWHLQDISTLILCCHGCRDTRAAPRVSIIFTLHGLGEIGGAWAAHFGAKYSYQRASPTLAALPVERLPANCFIRKRWCWAMALLPLLKGTCSLLRGHFVRLQRGRLLNRIENLFHDVGDEGFGG